MEQTQPRRGSIALSTGTNATSTKGISPRNNIPYNVLGVRDTLLERRKTDTLPMYSVPHGTRQWKCARWDCRSTDPGGRHFAPHHWNYEEPSGDGEVEASPRTWSSWSWSGWWQ